MNYFERNENWEIIYSIPFGQVLLNKSLALYQIEFGNMLMNFYENQFNDFVRFIFERDMTEICFSNQTENDKIVIQAQGTMSCYSFSEKEFGVLQTLLKDALNVLQLLFEINQILFVHEK